METLLLTTEDADIRRGAQIIKNGGLVAFPTETVYGLGADAFDPKAAKRSYAAKGRPSDNPLIVHIAKTEELYSLATEVPAEALKLAEAFWPGPLTMVLPKRPEVPKETTGGLDTVAVRMPRSAATLKLIEYSGTALSGPSANVSGRPSPTSWLHVKNDLDGRIDAIICGDPSEVGIESTVLDLTEPEKPVILRPGYVTPEMISAVCGREVSYDPALFAKPSEDPSYRPKAPGQKYKHYAPKAEMLLFEGPEKEVLAEIKRRLKTAQEEGIKTGVIAHPDPRTFFAQLREFDAQGCGLILAAAPDDSEEFTGSLKFSLMNRMLKAAGYNIIKVGGRQNMKIAIASDHGGFVLKQPLVEHLKEKGYEVADLGIYEQEPVDYPIYGKKCAEYVVSGQADKGILCCGTGIGIGIAANKIHGIRCALLVTPFMAEMAAKHNHANMVSLGGRIVTPEQACELVDIWLETEEEHGRHDRRVALLDEM